jgi:hypothetical protein
MDGVEEGHKEEYYEVEDQRFLGPQGFGEMLENQTVEGESCSAQAKSRWIVARKNRTGGRP